MRVWTVGYGGLDIRTGPARGGSAEVVCVGSCLATSKELAEARDAAERGHWEYTARLPGSFVALVRHGATAWVFGDRAGVHPVYWVADGGLVWWSTSAMALAALHGKRPDHGRLLAVLTTRGVDHLGSKSLFSGIHRVPPGSALVLSPGWPARTVPVPGRTEAVALAEAAPVLREVLTTAVTRRAASAVSLSADLSGGLDSSTLASLAAARGSLLGITYTDRHMAESDDPIYAARVAVELPHLIHRIVHGGDQQVRHFDRLDNLDALPITDSPSLSLGLLGVKAATLAPAVAAGSQLHLTGRGGDDVLDAMAPVLIDQYLAGHRAAAVGRAWFFARSRRTSPHRVLARAARTCSEPYPKALAGLAALLGGTAALAPPRRRPPSDLLAWCFPLASAAWLTPAGRLATASVVAEQAEVAASSERPGRLHERISLERMGEEHATYDQISRRLWSLPVHAPFLDNAVVDVCHAVPGWQRSVPGDYKPLGRAAFAGVVPATLLQRRTKTHHTGGVHDGLRYNLPVLQQILTGSQLAQAGLIDSDQAVAELNSGARGEPAFLYAVHLLVVIELWLRTLRISREQWWELAPVKEAA
ncbi:asparagine synthase-related protein [Streptomyces sp. A1547]|uniref:asparagine synthase-related protein n=1 Tax=Streptomyces sp. A1547 TaxID=2563105 RepID=UPI00144AF32F|nr:asparagine synthase-related protein [Streptomyces sp. A1547]